MVALTSPKDRVNYFPCSALSILPEVRWDCVSRLSSGRTLGGDRSNSDQESLNSKVGLAVAVVVIDRVPGMLVTLGGSFTKKGLIEDNPTAAPGYTSLPLAIRMPDIWSEREVARGVRISPSLGSTELGVGLPVPSGRLMAPRTERAESLEPDKPQKLHDTTSFFPHCIHFAHFATLYRRKIQ